MTSLKNCQSYCKNSFTFSMTVLLSRSLLRREPSIKVWQARRDSNPQPPVLETGALAVELLAYWFPYTSFGLLMESVQPAKFTVFLELKLVGSTLLIFVVV